MSLILRSWKISTEKMKSRIYMIFSTLLFFQFKQNKKVDIVHRTTSPIGRITQGKTDVRRIYSSGNITESEGGGTGFS